MGLLNNPRKSRKIFVDMDDCIADFGIHADFEDSMKRYKVEKGFFRHLNPTCSTIHRALMTLKACGYTLIVLTHSPNSQAHSDKMAWINCWFPRIFDHVICTDPSNPKGHYVKDGDILIDNWNGNLKSVQESNGIPIKVQFHNRESTSWDGYKVKNLFCEVLDIVEEIEIKGL